MGSRQNVRRPLGERAKKLRRDRKAAQKNYRPLFESLERRELLTGTWATVAPTNPNALSTPGVQTLMMLSDGRAILADNNYPNSSVLNTFWYPLSPSSTGSYINGTFGAPATMNTTRLFFPSVMLQDGRIFAIGGEYGVPTGFVNAPEIYDPKTNVWTRVPDMPSPQTQAAQPGQLPPTTPRPQFGDDPLEILPNGDVLAGWFGGGQTFVYSPTTNSWRVTTGAKLHFDNSNFPGGTNTDRSDEESWTKLPDGSILSYDVFASEQAGRFLAQRFIPSQDVWVDASATNPLDPPPILTTGTPGINPDFGSELGPGVLLPDGRTIVFGANGASAIYDYRTNLWTRGPDQPQALVNGLPTQFAATDNPAAVLPNGKVLIAMSPNTVASSTPFNILFLSPTRFYEFDPSNNTFTDVTPGGISQQNAQFFKMLVLPTGQIFVADSLNNANLIYTPDGAPQDSWRPTIQSISDNGNGSFTLTGTQLNGINEGAYYGDDAAMASNYPLLRLTDKLGNISYARTFNWSETGVATGNKSVTTQFTLPTGTRLTDYASYTVVANGIPSLPFQFFPTAPQNISGTKYNDRNGDGIRDFDDLNSNGIQDPGEPSDEGVPNVLIYLDLNNDGKCGITEPATMTNNYGQFLLKNVPPGNYVLREAPAPNAAGFQTQPGSVDGAYHLNVLDRVLTNMDFGNNLSTANDFGDAPDSYGTTLATNGARAGVYPNFHLGLEAEDGEKDGQPTLDATGDNTNGVNDEQGVAGIQALPQGGTKNVVVTVTNGNHSPGKLSGWIDFNHNGIFDASERVVANKVLSSTQTTISITVPAATQLGPTFARFRYGYENDIGPTGPSQAGEVEDYQVFVLPNNGAPTAVPDTFPDDNPPELQAQGIIKPSSVNYQLDVLGNDIGGVNSFGQPLTISAVTTPQPGGGTLSVVFNSTLGRQVLAYTPGAGVQGGVDQTFTYQIQDALGNKSNFATDTIHISLANNIAIDDTFTLGSNINPTLPTTAVGLAAMANDLTPYPLTPQLPTDKHPQIIAVGILNPGDATADPIPPPPTGQTMAIYTQASTNLTATLSIDLANPQTVDFTADPGFVGTAIFKYEIDEDPLNDDPNTGASTRFITVQVVDGGVNAADSQLVAAHYLAELDTTVVAADANGNPTNNGTVVHAGDTFYLRVQSHDLRGPAPPNGPGNLINSRGMQAAYLDMLLGPSATGAAFRQFARPVPDPDTSLPMTSMTFVNGYNDAQQGQDGVNNASGAGEFNETGATRTATTGLGTGFFTVFYVKMRAFLPTPVVNGQRDFLTVSGDPADVGQNGISLTPNDVTVDPAPVNPTEEQVFLHPTQPFQIFLPGEAEFTNFVNPKDVNLDGDVSASDVITVINTINAGGSRSLLGQTPSLNTPMYDVNADSNVTSMDVIMIINYINSFSVMPHSTAKVSSQGEAGSSTGVDASLTSLSSPSGVQSNGTSSSSTPTLLTSGTSSSSNSSSSTSSPTTGSTGTQSQTTSSSTSSSTVNPAAADDIYAGLDSSKQQLLKRYGR